MEEGKWNGEHGWEQNGDICVGIEKED